MPHHPAQAQIDAGFFERLFLSSGFAILSCRPDGVITAWNSAANKLFCEREPACLEERPLIAVLPQPDRATAERCFRDCIETGQTTEFLTRLGGGEGREPQDYAVLLTPVPDDEGGVEGVAAWFRDVTPRMRLQHIVDKQKRLNLLGELAGAVAHHYNNLLCSIGTSVEYALNMNTMSAMRRMLRRTSEAVSRASGITQQLLAFAQADYRSSDLSDLTEAFLIFFDEVEPSLAQRGVHLSVEWEKIPYTAVLREPLRIVLNNVVNNAVDAMPRGGTLSVKLARRSADTAIITILDSGGGISAADMEHLFEPFHTTKGVKGSGEARTAGLGLAVAHGLVAEMNGAISGVNPPEGGARFDIVLPIGTKA